MGKNLRGYRRLDRLSAAGQEIAGGVGRWWLAHLSRLIDQAGFAGRLFRLSRRHLFHYRDLLVRLILAEIFKLIKGALPLILTVGFIVGAAWAFVWLGPLSHLGVNINSVASVLITLNALLLAPIMVSVIVIFSYGSATTWDLAVMKATRQLETLTRLGIPPEHFLALPRIAATVVVMPAILACFILVSFIGAYVLVWQYTGNSVLAFIISLNDNTRALHFTTLMLKSLVISLTLSFFSVYGGFEAEVEGLGEGAGIISQAMAEAFFFSILASLLVSAFLR